MRFFDRFIELLVDVGNIIVLFIMILLLFMKILLRLLLIIIGKVGLM